jgi:flagellar biosynthesis repressor protein FlbT
MALKITLRPQERLIIGGAVVTNGDSRSELLIENAVPVLREKDILGERNADSPCRRIYFAVQLMYVDGQNLARHHALYWSLVQDVLDAAPGTLPLIEQINEQVLCGRYYQALKQANKLIAYEQEAISRVHQSTRSV